jgi:hypothetical protein
MEKGGGQHRSRGGTQLVAVHDGLPPGLSAAANEMGWEESLDRPAALTETNA